MEDFIKDYIDGMAIKDIQDKYNMSTGKVYYTLNKLGVRNRGKLHRYNNPFIVDSPERDYWLGWIFSDGHVGSYNNRVYQVYLACLDIDILIKFKNFCGERAKLSKFYYTTPVSKERKEMYKVSIYSKELVNYFKENYNIESNKASSLNPSIQLNWNIMRGLYDGDGSFKKGVVITSMSEKWINKIKRFYESNNLHYTCTYDTGYRLGIYRREDIIKVFHHLYDNTDLYLERKRLDLSRLAIE